MRGGKDPLLNSRKPRGIVHRVLPPQLGKSVGRIGEGIGRGSPWRSYRGAWGFWLDRGGRGIIPLIHGGKEKAFYWSLLEGEQKIL